MIETAMIGNDGSVGSAALNNPISLNRAVVQVAGAAAALSVNQFCELVQESATFRADVARHEQFLLAQAQQAAACNATHSVEQRLSRWLLRCHDLVAVRFHSLRNSLPRCWGVRRTSVTLVAMSLQHAGLIEYSRGHVRLLDLDGLRESTLACYLGDDATASFILFKTERLYAALWEGNPLSGTREAPFPTRSCERKFYALRGGVPVRTTPVHEVFLPRISTLMKYPA
jgi:hypothetical protein